MQSHAALSLKPDYAAFSPYPKPLHNPGLSSRTESWRYYSVLKYRGLEIPVRKHRLNSLTVAYESLEDEWAGSFAGKDIDVATLGNLCLDVVLSVPKLPPKPLDERKAYLEELSKSAPDKKHWEAGGNCNMAIAAARLGMRVVTVGHVGDEIYGRFLMDVLADQGIAMVEMNEENAGNDISSASYETLVCWVLVDSLQRHGFCSRADFSKEPAFSWLTTLSNDAKMAIRRSKLLFCNGYGFDELSPHLLVSALSYAIEVGASVFFDPGPRGKCLISGTREERMALEEYLRFSDVLLLTAEEVEALTGIEDPILAGKELLRNGKRTKWVIIKMGCRGSIIITPSTISCAPGFKVNVVDTVGCGDSFVAAIAFGYIHKLPLVYTLAIGNAVGAATAMGRGAGRNVARLSQAMELIRASKLIEDDEFWETLLEPHSGSGEITLLTTKRSADGSSSQRQRVPLERVVADLLPMLEAAAEMKHVGAC